MALRASRVEDNLGLTFSGSVSYMVIKVVLSMTVSFEYLLTRRYHKGGNAMKKFGVIIFLAVFVFPTMAMARLAIVN